MDSSPSQDENPATPSFSGVFWTTQLKTQPIKPKKPGHDPGFLVAVFRARRTLTLAKK
jgi:hypothetical protein